MALYDGALGEVIDAFAALPGIGPKGAQRIAFYLLKSDAQKSETLAESILDLKRKVRFCSICGNICEGTTCAVCRDPRRDATLICVVQEPKDVFSIERTQQYRGLYHVLGGVIDPMSGVRPQDLRIDELLARLGPHGARVLDAAAADPDAASASPGFVERPDAGFAGRGIYTSLAAAQAGAASRVSRDGAGDDASGAAAAADLRGAADGEAAGDTGSNDAPTARAPLPAFADGPQVREVILALDQDIEGDATTGYLASILARRGVTVSRLATGLPVGSDLEYADEETLARAFQGRRAV